MKQILAISLALLGFAQAMQLETTTHFITTEGKWVPDQYSTGDDDQLMKNLIDKGLAFT